MHKNNSNSDYSTPRMATEAAVANLLLNHAQMQQTYDRAATTLNDADDQLSTTIAEMASDHAKWEEELRAIAKDLPGSPHTPSNQGSSYLNEKTDHFDEAVRTKNHVSIYQIAVEANKQLSEFYGQVLATGTLNSAAEKLIKQQGDELLQQQRKLERLEAVPK